MTQMRYTIWQRYDSDMTAIWQRYDSDMIYDIKRCLRKFDTDKINFEPILAITNNRDTDYKYFW